MNQLFLSPTDVLFFRDGRPMSGSLAGHGTAWPLPTVTNAALHAALHRADLQGVHGHDHHQKGGEKIPDARKFGSLLTAGPFPVTDNNEWLFPRPLDAGKPAGTEATLLPLKRNDGESSDIPWRAHSSLPEPLIYATANTETASKDAPAPWWNQAAWNAYLANGAPDSSGPETPASETRATTFHHDSDFSDPEHQIGIGIDPATATQKGEQFYSAHYLRLKPDHQLGLLAEAQDKINGDPADKRDLIESLIEKDRHVIVGGQQRLCTVRRSNTCPIPLPQGLTANFKKEHLDGKDTWLVKWVLLSPAIFPAIDAGTSKRGTERNAHPGGWLPTWICPKTGKVLLQSISKEERKRRRQLNYAGKGYDSQPDTPATLVAAMVGKPIPVTGYALANEADPDRSPGPKPTHLAVPAGSVYYFTTTEPEKLAAALNWHGSDSEPTTIRNRRSTLFGEKGFGLGVCGTWQFHNGKLPT